jgi:hypothetical protein
MTETKPLPTRAPGPRHAAPPVGVSPHAGAPPQGGITLAPPVADTQPSAASARTAIGAPPPHFGPAPDMQYGGSGGHYPGPNEVWGPDATSGSPPAVWPVALFTLFFGWFGAISAFRRSSKARDVGVSAARYWITFGIVAAFNFVLGFLVMFALAIPVYLNYRDTVEAKSTSMVMTSERLEKGLASEPDSGILRASCTAVKVGSTGVGEYRCLVDVTGRSQVPVLITVAANGLVTPHT